VPHVVAMILQWYSALMRTAHRRIRHPQAWRHRRTSYSRSWRQRFRRQSMARGCASCTVIQHTALVGPHRKPRRILL